MPRPRDAVRATEDRPPSALGSGTVPNPVAGRFGLSTTPRWPVRSPAGQHPVAAAADDEEVAAS